MTRDQVDQAAAALWKHWQDGTVMSGLESSCRPETRRQGYDIQARLAAFSGRPATGWKIAATSAAGQAHIGVDGPLGGRLLVERTYSSGATVVLAGNRMRVAEPEFAFRCGKRLAARTKPYSEAEVVAAIDALIPALEIPDSRFDDFVHAGAAQLIADCACARDFILGAPASGGWRQLDLAQHPVRAKLAGSTEREGCGRNVLGDPRIALTWLVNELSSLGIALEPGEVVTTGTCMPPLAVDPGDHVLADFGVLGRVEARFA